MWADYDLFNRSSWEPMEAPTVDRAWEEALTRIGGLNPFGKPMLRWVWGATHRDEMSTDNGLKYWLANKESTLIGFAFTDPVTGLEIIVKKMEDVPESVLLAVPKYTGLIELGERRIIIEQWRSAEFLARSGRYQTESVRDRDRVEQFYFCKGCDNPLTTGNDGPEPCSNCGSKRSYLREARFEGDGQLLRTLREEGCYDFFMRLENAEGEPMEADGNALQWIERLWHEQHTKSLKEKLADMVAETASQEALNRAATSPANPFQAPSVPGG